MGRVRLYVATSLDGFIADREGAVDWLAAYDPRSYGFDAFMGEVGAVVMGRRTFEFARMAGEDWPYAGKRAYVLTSRALSNVPDGVLPTSKGLAGAIELARGRTEKDIWIVGGALTMQAALDAGCVDAIEIFIVPVLLGRGLPLIADLKQRMELSFVGIETYRDGVVKLTYAAPAASA